MQKAVFALITGVTLIASVPVALQAQPSRYYDRDHKDYHQWNDGEERAYRHWLVEERHHAYHDWKHASAAEQRAYWAWRHSHPDWH